MKPLQLLLFVCCLVAGGAIASVTGRAEAPVGTHTERDVGAGLLRLSGPFGYVPAIQLSAKAHFRVTGLVAHVTLEQSFHNSTGEWVEGEYLFPLPGNAAVNRLRLVVGERVIVGEIREKEAARQVYEQARASGRKASLVEQRRPNLFSNRVANIAPGEVVKVEISYVQRVSYRDGQFSLRFPMTVTPRYSPPNHPGAAAVWQFQNPVPATDANPIHPIELTAEINMGLPLEEVGAPYHSLAMTRERETYRLALAAGQTPMDRDFLLTWRPQVGSAPQAAVFHERIGAQEYALLMVLPPVAQAPGPQLPRELVFVIDTSGSMGGTSIQQARASLSRGLSLLRPGDRFNIVEFNSRARALFPHPVDADRHHLARAAEFVRHLDAGGGTEMKSALELALPLPAPDSGGLLRQVVFITDGAVGNEVELFREIRRRLGASRLFTVGIGSAPNGWFMRKAAQAGRGDFVHIGDILEVQQGMQSLFERLSQTLIANINVDWPVAVDAHPRAIPDLYPGEPLVIAARSAESFGGGSVTVSGLGAGEGWQKTLQFSQAPEGMEAAYTGIGAVWARAAIEALLDEKTLGRDEEEVRSAVLPLALEHQLVSPWTSFVAVEQQPSRAEGEPLARKPVPNLRPRGQSAQPFAWPQTATTSRLNLYLGLLALLMACVFWRSPAWSWR